jgi:hypothetical protein
MRGGVNARRVSATSPTTSFNAEYAENAENVNGALQVDGNVRDLSFSACSALSAVRRRRGDDATLRVRPCSFSLLVVDM